MKRSDAEKLYFFVGSKDNLDALGFYAELRIAFLKDQLVTAKDIEEVRKYQGAIEELRRIRNLKDEVQNPKD